MLCTEYRNWSTWQMLRTFKKKNAFIVHIKNLYARIYNFHTGYTYTGQENKYPWLSLRTHKIFVKKVTYRSLTPFLKAAFGWT